MVWIPPPKKTQSPGGKAGEAAVVCLGGGISDKVGLFLYYGAFE
jgi:hypothetical protein